MADKPKNALWDAYDPDAGRDCIEFSFDKPKAVEQPVVVNSPVNCNPQYSGWLAQCQQNAHQAAMGQLQGYQNSLNSFLGLGGLGAGLFNPFK